MVSGTKVGYGIGESRSDLAQVLCREDCESGLGRGGGGGGQLIIEFIFQRHVLRYPFPFFCIQNIGIIFRRHVLRFFFFL